MIIVRHLDSGSKVVGTKQTLKALEKHEVKELYVAKDASKQHIQPILQIAKSQNIKIVYIDTMEELGKACNVEVKTATAALI
jgi:large subunit ribosomal protein L7A